MAEFDQNKRSCRRRLTHHNARRRKPQADAISFNSSRLSSMFYGSTELSKTPSKLMSYMLLIQYLFTFLRSLLLNLIC